MKAFVQIQTDNQFANPNYFEAWRGFKYLGYDVETFYPHDFYRMNITKETPCFAGVDITKKIFNKLNINHKELESYPSCLDPFLNRNIYILSIGEIKQLIQSGESVFIKPQDKDRKLFEGIVIKELKDLDKVNFLIDPYEVYCSDLINFLVEYRVFIHNGKILDSRKYRGNFELNIDYNVVRNAMRSMKNAPVAYCLDFGLTDQGKTALVEVTDSWSMGHYGLDMLHFVNMIIDRWNEIVYKG